MNKIIKSVGQGLASAGSTMLSIQFYVSIILIVIIIIGLIIFNIVYKEPKTQDAEPIRLNINIVGLIFLIVVIISAVFSYFARQNPYISGVDATLTGVNLIKNIFN